MWQTIPLLEITENYLTFPSCDHNLIREFTKLNMPINTTTIIDDQFLNNNLPGAITFKTLS